MRFEPVYEVIDSTHCQFFSGTGNKCGKEQRDLVGFQELSDKYFTHEWGDTIISDYFAFENELR